MLNRQRLALLTSHNFIELLLRDGEFGVPDKRRFALGGVISAIEESAFFAPTEEALGEKADPLVALCEAPSRFLVMTMILESSLRHG
jgi:hypothetical protein